MKTQTKLFTVLGITAALVLALAAGGWFINTAFAQGPWQGGNWGAMHNNQAVFDLLKTTQTDLLKERQAGTSLLDIATAKGVSEQALLDALLQPMTQMQAWMAQMHPQSNTAQMTEWMRQQFAQDLRVTQYGTMTDMHLLGGVANGYGMMGNWNGGNDFGGMMNGNGMMGGGMMGGWNGNNGYGGMMGGWNGNNGYGGMMGGWNNAPNINATPVPATQPVDQEIKLTARNFKFDPASVQVKPGATVKFTVTNQDNFAHNMVSQDGKLGYALLPANQTTSILWTAPNQAGTFNVLCTWHPGMQLQVVVK